MPSQASQSANGLQTQAGSHLSKAEPGWQLRAQHAVQHVHHQRAGGALYSSFATQPLAGLHVAGARRISARGPHGLKDDL